MGTNELLSGFNRAFPDGGDPRFFYAPGRVNLIGEHIDYNGGYVFPCALTLGTYAAISPRSDDTIRMVSATIEPSVTISTNNLDFDPVHKWANNPKGVVKLLKGMGHQIGGFDLYIWGNLPNNAGLSSSASINVLVTLALNTVFELGLGPIEIALHAQRVENEYMGVNCGIMDQFASAMGRKDHAILLNCGNLDYKYVPLELGEYKLVLANTNKRRTLADSKYNERRAECEHALSILKTVCEIENLCDLPFDDQFESLCRKAFGDSVVNNGVHGQCNIQLTDKPEITSSPEDIAYRRAYHAISENHRVKSATESLNKGDLAAFGTALTASHLSLKGFYEVTGYELDALALAAHEFEEEPQTNGQTRTKMLGSRMTGAGFGGCTVSIVHKDSVEDFIDKVGQRYTQLTGLTASFYVAATDDGAREIF